MPRYVVTEFIEQPRFRVERDSILRAGAPYVEVLYQERMVRIREELTRHHSRPPGVRAHPDLDGSYLFEVEGLIVRYFITPAPRPGWLQRLRGRPGGRPDEIPVRVRFQGVEWPDLGRCVGS